MKTPLELYWFSWVIFKWKCELFLLSDGTILEINFILLLFWKVLKQKIFRIGFTLNPKFVNFILIEDRLRWDLPYFMTWFSRFKQNIKSPIAFGSKSSGIMV